MKLRWPKPPPAFVRTNLAGHSALGLFVAAFCYLICLTGTVAVFGDEWHGWELADAPHIESASPELMQSATEAALQAWPNPEWISLELPSVEAPRFAIMSFANEQERYWTVSSDGALHESRDAKWAHFIASLHASLNMPGMIGYILVGLVGIAMLALAVTGLLAHPRIFRDALTLRWGGGARLQEADLHNRLSVWGLPFNIVISTTGAYFGLVTFLIYIVAAAGFGGDDAPITAAFTPPEITHSAPLLPRLADIVAQAETHAGARATSVFINHPGQVDQSLELFTGAPGKIRYGELYYPDAEGDVRNVGWANGPPGVQLYSAIYPAHFGDFGGLPMKLIYAALGFALTVVCASGVTIWLARRADQDRPAPIAQRAWTAIVWATPVAIAVCASLSLLTPADPLWSFWLSFAAACLISAAPPQRFAAHHESSACAMPRSGDWRAHCALRRCDRRDEPCARFDRNSLRRVGAVGSTCRYIVGMTKLEPSSKPSGQRAVTVLPLV
jgi:uncharacterized iron-regulated membrane protein